MNKKRGMVRTKKSVNPAREGGMMRTRRPSPGKGMVRLVEYIDKDRAYRMGRLVEERRAYVLLIGVFGERVEVPKNRTIKEHITSVERLKAFSRTYCINCYGINNYPPTL
jgi:hypothetical protein